MAVLDTSVVNVAVPSIHAELHAVRRRAAAGRRRLLDRLRGAAGHRRPARRHRRPPPDVPGRAGPVHPGLARLRAGRVHRALIALRFVQGAGAAADDPAGAQPDPAHLHRRRPGRGDARCTPRCWPAAWSLGQIVGGLLVSANLFGSAWRPVFLVNVPIGVRCWPRARGCCRTAPGTAAAAWTRPGLALLTPAVLALVLPLVLGQPEHWPAWGWACLAASAVLFAAVRRRRAAGGGPRRLAADARPAAAAARASRPGSPRCSCIMAVFGGFFFALALHLQGGLGDTPLRAGLTFAPAAADLRAGQPQLAAAARGSGTGPDHRGLRRLRGRPAAAAGLLHGGGTGGVLAVPGSGADRRRDGGRVQPADDRAC